MALDKSDVQNLLDEFVVNNKTEILDVEKDNPQLHSAVINALAFLSTRFGTQKGIELPTKPTEVLSTNYQKQKAVITEIVNPFNLAKGELFGNLNEGFQTFTLLFDGIVDVLGERKLKFYDDFHKEQIITFDDYKNLIEQYELNLIPDTVSFDREITNFSKVRVVFRKGQKVQYAGRECIITKLDKRQNEINIYLYDEKSQNEFVVPYGDAEDILGIINVRISTNVPFADDFVKGQFLVDERDNGFGFLLYEGDSIGGAIPIFAPYKSTKMGIPLQNNYLLLLMSIGLITIKTKAVFVNKPTGYEILDLGDKVEDVVNRETWQISEIFVQGTIKDTRMVRLASLNAVRDIEIREDSLVVNMKYKRWVKVVKGKQPAPSTISQTSAPKKSAPKKSTTTKVAKVPNKDREIKRIQKLIDGLQILADLGDDESIKQIAEFEKEIRALSKS
jgi:hypothetical protein